MSLKSLIATQSLAVLLLGGLEALTWRQTRTGTILRGFGDMRSPSMKGRVLRIAKPLADPRVAVGSKEYLGN
jgi:hypothetical protein